MMSVAIAEGLRTASTSAPARSSVATMRRSWSRSEEIARTRFDKVPRAWPRHRPACGAYHGLQFWGGLGPVLALLPLVALLLLRALHRLNPVILGLERALGPLRVGAVAVDDDVRPVVAHFLVPPQHAAAAHLVGGRYFVGLGRRAVLRGQRLAERRVLRERLAGAKLESDVVH